MALVHEVLRGSLAERPELVIVDVDATSPARGLYQLGEVLDLGIPTAVALAVPSSAPAGATAVNPDRLAEVAGVPVVVVSDSSRSGLDRFAETAPAVPRPVDLGEQIEPVVADLAGRVGALTGTAGSRHLALSMLTGQQPDIPAELTSAVASARSELTERLADELADGPETGDLETAIAERRYAWVHRVIGEVVRQPEDVDLTAAQWFDRIATSRWFGMPLFLLVMWGVFTAATTVAAPMQRGLAWLLANPVSSGVLSFLKAVHLDQTWFTGLVMDGVIAGVGQLLTFAPLMVIMFALLILLEDSGYMSRAAFSAERFLRVLGLPGQAFVPLIVGFGCNVPAVAGARALSDARHRLVTTLLVPFASCSARLTVYVLLANVFFGRHAGTVVFGMYLLSVALMVLVGAALRLVFFRGRPAQVLLLELTPYQMPDLRVMGRQVWHRLLGFLRTASTIVVMTVCVVWLLAATPLSGRGGFGNPDQGRSLYDGLTRTVAPLLAPAGFDDPSAVGALVTGFVAKEAVVSTLATANGASPTSNAGPSMAEQLRSTFDRSSGGHPGPAVLAFLVFVLAYTPCMATLAAQRAEIGARWTMAGVVTQLAIAWALAVLVFQIGRLIT